MTRAPFAPQNKPAGPYAKPTEIRYHGRRDSHGRAQVYMEKPGSPAQIFNPPADYEWGYAGTGPARLAGALLYQHSGGAAELVREHQHEFKEQVIRRLPQEGWTFTDRHISQWLQKQEAATAPEPILAPTPPPSTAKTTQPTPAGTTAATASAAGAVVPYRPAA